MKIITVFIALFLISGCGTVIAAKQGSFATQAYALEADYTAIQGAAAMYVVRPDADPWTKRHIKETNRRATAALDILGDVAEGGTLAFCAGTDVVAVPTNTDHAFAQLACDKDMPGVLAKTAQVVGMLNSVMIELEGR